MKKAQRVLRTGDEIRTINRNRKMVVYSDKNPTAPISREVRGYLTKKQQMSEVMPTDPNYQEKLLEDLLSKIKEILK